MSRLNVTLILLAIELYYKDNNRKYKIIDNETDAILYYHMSEDVYFDRTVSEIALNRGGRNMLQWMLITSSFPYKLRKVIEYQLNHRV